MKKNADSPIWSILEARWADLMDECRALCTETVFVRWERTAADELLKVGANVPVRTITETVAAVVALQEDEPRQFKSDDAFRVQLARRVRGLTDTNCGSTYDHRRRKVRRVYRDIPLKAAIAFGRNVIDALGVTALKLVRLESEERARADAAKVAHHEALAGLQ